MASGKPLIIEGKVGIAFVIGLLAFNLTVWQICGWAAAKPGLAGAVFSHRLVVTLLLGIPVMFTLQIALRCRNRGHSSGIPCSESQV